MLHFAGGALLRLIMAEDWKVLCNVQAVQVPFSKPWNSATDVFRDIRLIALINDRSVNLPRSIIRFCLTIRRSSVDPLIPRSPLVPSFPLFFPIKSRRKQSVIVDRKSSFCHLCKTIVFT